MSSEAWKRAYGKGKQNRPGIQRVYRELAPRPDVCREDAAGGWADP